jgi:DnaJ-class molecular chaperone
MKCRRCYGTGVRYVPTKEFPDLLREVACAVCLGTGVRILKDVAIGTVIAT